MKKLYLDWDCTIVQTIKCIVDLYNEDYKFYKNHKPIKWWEVETWDFTECNCATPEQIDNYFNTPRFFEKIEFMPWANEVINKLSNYYDITIVSMGHYPNLRGKKLWIERNLPMCNFIGVDFEDYKDKKHIDMSDGILVDDVVKNCKTSNAIECIVFGDIYEWNKYWNGQRIANWKELEMYLLGDNNTKEELS